MLKNELVNTLVIYGKLYQNEAATSRLYTPRWRKNVQIEEKILDFVDNDPTTTLCKLQVRSE